MSESSAKTLGRYVAVLDQQRQQAQAEQGRAQAQLARTQSKLELLQEMGRTAQLKKTAANVALYQNAAGFRSNLLDVAQQFRDARGVQQLELAQAQQRTQYAMRRHESMSSVLEQKQLAVLQMQHRQAQKSMDEMAGQSWWRQRHGTT
jgi:flagellar biosynthesis chaperone FliJ